MAPGAAAETGRTGLLPLWLVLARVVLIDLVWIVAAGWRVNLVPVLLTLLLAAAVQLPRLVPRYRTDAHISSITAAAGFLLLFTQAGAALSYLVVATGAPLVDAPLRAIDVALGFDFDGVDAWLRRHPGLATAARLVYDAGLPQIAFVPLALGLLGRYDRLREFLALFVLATLVTVLLSGFFPAAGPWSLGGQRYTAQASAMSHFAPLHAGTLKALFFEPPQGLISCPSLHTQLGLIFIYSLRRLPWLAAPAWGLNAAMIAATPTEGGHYLIDVIAGALLAVLLIVVARRCRRPSLAPAP